MHRKTVAETLLRRIQETLGMYLKKTSLDLAEERELQV